MPRALQRLPFALTVFVGCHLLLYPASAGAADVIVALDQHQTAQNTSGMIGSGGGVGEVFTAGQSGYLAFVSLYLGQYTLAPATAVNIRIETVTSEGLPSGKSIGYGWIPAENIREFGGWVNAEIAGAFVTAGTKYALLLSTMNGMFLWYSASGDVKPYARGYWVDKAAGVWVKILTNQDWTFKTYVAPDTLDQNQSQTSGSGAGTRALGTTAVGQTFTVGLHGFLDRVSVYLANSSSSPGPITVTVLEVTSDGLPASGTQVASGTIPAEAIPGPGYRDWVTTRISPFIVTPGTRYALLLSTAVNGPQWVLVSDVYAGGTVVIRNGIRWTTASSDFAFQVYVLEPILDNAQTRVDYSTSFGAGGRYGQAFTARLSGKLDRVWVVVGNDSDAPIGNVTVSIYSVLTRDGSSAIETATIPVTSLPATGGLAWIIATFNGVYVTAGSQYFLVVDGPDQGNAIAVGYAFGSLAYWYPGGHAVKQSPPGWWWSDSELENMAFKTYLLPVVPSTTAPGPGSVMPCVDGVCPGASGGFTPADLTDGVISHFQFQERPDGTVQGILNFSDPRPDGIALHGCTTESAACTLAVTGFICTDAQSMIVGGTYTTRKGTASNYRLTLSGASDGPGTFSLTAGHYAFTLTLDGIVNLTCPPTVSP